MTTHERKTRIVPVLSALALVLVLAASLVARVSARSEEPSAPPATVPPPRPIVLAELPTPFCWGCSWNVNAPLEFQLDLDLLAPLGNGSANAGLWFARFVRSEAESSGREFNGYRERRVVLTIDGREWPVLPGDDPLLLEAEPWVDQATLSFYPEIWEPSGMDTPLPNLLMMLDLARSWVARGKLSDNTEDARADFRRAIRLGRLLRQDDVTIVQDLVAIACIRLGAEAFYELARGEGDGATMTVAALILADKDAMRQQTARRITTLERAVRVQDPEEPTLTLNLTDAALESVIELLREVPERRFRIEGLIGMHAVKHLGTPAQRRKAIEVLDESAASDDEMTATLARRFRDTEFDAEELRSTSDRP